MHHIIALVTLSLLFSAAVAAYGANSTCDASRQRDMAMLLGASYDGLDLSAVEKRVSYVEGDLPAADKVLIWKGGRKFDRMELEIFGTLGTKDDVVSSNPVQVAMKKVGSSLNVKVLVKLNNDGEEIDVKEWQMRIENAAQSNVCARAQDALTQIEGYSDINQDLVKCIGCFSILGLSLPILWNLVLGYGFSLACRSKGVDETTCDELSINFVLAMELPVIFICAYQTYQRCLVKNTFCQDAGKTQKLLL